MNIFKGKLSTSSNQYPILPIPPYPDLSGCCDVRGRKATEIAQVEVDDR